MSTGSVVIEQQASVDVIGTTAKPAADATEETMEQYAARRDAEMRGEKPPVVEKPAAVTDDAKPAAATDKSAAATDEHAADDKTATASATEEDPEKLIEEAHPAKKGISKRMGELTAQRKDAEAKAEAAKKEAADAKAEAARLTEELATAKKAAEAKPAPVVPAAEEDPAPVRDDFEDPDAYQAALTGHAARQEIRKANALAEEGAKAQREEQAREAETKRQAKVQEQIADLHKTFNERVEKIKPDYADYDDKVTNNEKLTLRNDIFFTVEQSEMAPHILYYLADHPDEAASLNTLPPLLAAIRLGELQSEIRIARKPKPSKAAEPIKPIGSRSSPERKTPDEMSMDEYAAMRDSEERSKRAGSRRAH